MINVTIVELIEIVCENDDNLPYSNFCIVCNTIAKCWKKSKLFTVDSVRSDMLSFDKFLWVILS